MGDISGVDTTVGDFDVDRLSTDARLMPTPIPSSEQKKKKKKRKLRRKDDATQISSEDFKNNLKDVSSITNKDWSFSPPCLRTALA